MNQETLPVRIKDKEVLNKTKHLSRLLNSFNAMPYKSFFSRFGN